MPDSGILKTSSSLPWATPRTSILTRRPCRNALWSRITMLNGCLLEDTGSSAIRRDGRKHSAIGCYNGHQTRLYDSGPMPELARARVKVGDSRLKYATISMPCFVHLCNKLPGYPRVVPTQGHSWLPRCFCSMTPSALRATNSISSTALADII